MFIQGIDICKTIDILGNKSNCKTYAVLSVADTWHNTADTLYSWYYKFKNVILSEKKCVLLGKCEFEQNTDDIGEFEQNTDN